jgi:short-subunit dehydrogenase
MNSKNEGAYLITGANSGIGLALATQLDRYGKRLILVDRNIDQLDRFSRHRLVKLDLTDRPGIRTLVSSLKHERFACLINNAGVGYKRSLETISLDEMFNTVDVNVIAPILLTKLLLPQLKADRASIVNIASSVAYNPLPNMSLYAASKAFMLSWSEALSYELRKTNRVLTISPSGTRTGFQTVSGIAATEDGRGLQTPDYMAARILARLTGSRRHSIVIGAARTRVLLLVSRLLPRDLNARLWGVLFERMS